MSIFTRSGSMNHKIKQRSKLREMRLVAIQGARKERTRRFMTDEQR
jgi:hypothetical protein